MSTKYVWLKLNTCARAHTHNSVPKLLWNSAVNTVTVSLQGSELIEHLKTALSLLSLQ